MVQKNDIEFFYKILNYEYQYYVNLFRKKMTTASPEVWSCDKPVNAEGILSIIKNFF